jgi:hypothetical protein
MSASNLGSQSLRMSAMALPSSVSLFRKSASLERTEKARLELTHGGSSHMIKEFEDRERSIEKLRSKLALIFSMSASNLGSQSLRMSAMALPSSVSLFRKSASWPGYLGQSRR